MADLAGHKTATGLANQIVEHISERVGADSPFIVGIAGPPGAGKTTLAKALVVSLLHQGVSSVYVPMDGFHLADVELARLHLAQNKGAIETFDASGYVSLLKRIKHPDRFTVYAPSFERDLEQPIAGAIPIFPGTSVVVTEGNYLLCPDEPWAQIRGIADQIWYCDVPVSLRRERLVARHIASGKSPEAAVLWVQEVDEANARLVGEWASAASAIIRQQI